MGARACIHTFTATPPSIHKFCAGRVPRGDSGRVYSSRAPDAQSWSPTYAYLFFVSVCCFCVCIVVNEIDSLSHTNTPHTRRKHDTLTNTRATRIYMHPNRREHNRLGSMVWPGQERVCPGPCSQRSHTHLHTLCYVCTRARNSTPASTFQHTHNTRKHTHKHTHSNTHTHTHTHTHVRKRTNTRTHAHACAYVHKFTPHARTHERQNTCTQTYRHTNKHRTHRRSGGGGESVSAREREPRFSRTNTQPHSLSLSLCLSHTHIHPHPPTKMARQ